MVSKHGRFWTMAYIERLIYLLQAIKYARLAGEFKSSEDLEDLLYDAFPPKEIENA